MKDAGPLLDRTIEVPIGSLIVFGLIAAQNITPPSWMELRGLEILSWIFLGLWMLLRPKRQS